MKNKTGHYRVDYEYAKMREVVLGGTALMLPPKGIIFDKYIDFSAHNPLGGGLRCKTGILSRYDD